MDPHSAALIAALSSTDEGRRTLAAMDEERKEACIHCQAVWYSIHYRDGVCVNCRKKQLPGRRELDRREAHRIVLRCMLMTAAVALSVSACIVFLFS